ncbi:C40 family peptidase [Ensifer soli]|uniref:C40 family peptidase n=1 Tax=Ciceribacter sp. sgz301302 TaxID=3342379 RepID=UPI0035B89234
MLDRRLNAFRPDLADRRLEGQVAAARFTEGRPACIVLPVAPLRPRPEPGAGIDTELLLGETVRLLDAADGWAWVVADGDGYVGYLPAKAVAEKAGTTTHIVTAPRTYRYAGPDLKRGHLHALSMGSRLSVTGEAETRGTAYLLLADGSAVVAGHCRRLDDAPAPDYVAVAARLLETPYLWGGRSAFGIDCSGLVQLSMLMAGRAAPRDSDMQASGLGTPVARDDLRRGDLVFWKGHVGIMEDEETLLHANGATMTVARERLDAAIARIAALYGDPTGCRRP